MDMIVRNMVPLGTSISNQGDELTLSVRIEFAHHHVGRVTYRRTANACNVTPQKGNSSLLQSIVAFLWFTQRSINIIHRRLKCGEFNHGIRDLAAPKWVQSLIQTSCALLGPNFPPSFPKCVGEGRYRCLHPDLDSLEGTERDIGQKLGRSGRPQINHGLVHVWKQLIAV